MKRFTSANILIFLAVFVTQIPAAAQDSLNYVERAKNVLYKYMSEAQLKALVKSNSCIVLEGNEVPKYSELESEECFYKDFGISCSSVNEDCKYQPSETQECKEVRIDCTNKNKESCGYHKVCEYSSKFWNRPMDSKGTPITFEEITSANYVVEKTADDSITSIKPIFIPRTARFEDNPVWWREVYYIEGIGSRAYAQKKLITREALDDWIRGEIGDEGVVSYEARLGYYIYKKTPAELVYETEWAVPARGDVKTDIDEKWRQR
jgi:hypothetical protein